jgi:nicotinamidase-related amidase
VSTALLLVDVINDLAFKGSTPLVRHAESMAGPLARLIERARSASIPVIYVNDNFGRWQSDWRKVVERCLRKDSPGHRVVERLQPQPNDYFVLKPKHSGFYSTTLDLLLSYLGVRVVVLTGIATDICILFTANDAYMRDYEVVVPHDCVAALTKRRSDFALEQIRQVLKGRTPISTSLRFPTHGSRRRSSEQSPSGLVDRGGSKARSVAARSKPVRE